MLTINTTAGCGRPFFSVHFQANSQWKRFFGNSWTPQILEIAWYYTSFIISLTWWIPLWKVRTPDRDNYLKWERHHWQKDHFWTKSYHLTSVAKNVVNPLILDMSILHNKSSWYWQSNFKWKDMTFTLKRNFDIDFHRDRDEVMPWCYVMILGVNYSFYFGPFTILLKDHVIKNHSKFQ